ncbi:AAA family ATPase [cf. Phormidesmis sp. LEGE 11477]|uniref:AAA family ATPase n=1 Tax=cf. Phormidesmis sp. LEGE 11477 TaxID=1828680 RepID=UPI00188111B6|nr:AAA family ATPase [cf. Phormidesmis sp. LEGE 11477]MBE9063948.1 AAA family ATPase [cf. Phormidesmis sp. LEGE 11477]
MGVDQMPFADNWAYLKTELTWLDRLLMLAIARQKKETKEVRKVAANRADVVSSHWWKGVILVPNPGYDDRQVVPTPRQRKSTGYQSQLENRIKLTAEESVVLALPSLRNYLNLTLFEKNLILMVLAPEVNRRYGQLYHFLQTGEESKSASDLPMMDLALRLLCRNDLERRRARASLIGPQSLIEKRILRYVSPRATTRLSSYLQLTEEWVDYLLAEQPDQQVLFQRLATSQPEPVLALPEPTAATRAVKIRQPAVSWDQLILPAPVISQLQTLCQQASASLLTRSQTGHTAMLVGAMGTGKTMAAGAIANSLRQPLCEIDLSQVHPDDARSVLLTLDAIRYPVLLIRSASVWFGRSADLPTASLLQWLQQRRNAPSLTLFSTRYLHTVKASWRQQMDMISTLPLPHKMARQTLLRQAFSGIVCSDQIDWESLAVQMKLSGGELSAIAQAAVAIAQSKHAKTVTFSHIQQAIKRRGLSINLVS